MELYRQKFRKCVVPACNGLYSLRYTFPKNNPKLFNKWLKQVPSKLLENKSVDEIYKTYVVCDLHFSEKFKVPWSKRGLTRNAFPTEFLPTAQQSCAAVSNVPPSTTSSTDKSKSSNRLEREITNLKVLPSNTTLFRAANGFEKARLSPSIHAMEMEILNLNEICRTCKREMQDMQSVFGDCDNDNSNKNPSIDEMLMACASVQVIEGDGLPSKICKTCMEQLKNAYQFQCQCEKVDTDLRKYALYLRNKEMREELQNCNSQESSNDSQKDSNNKLLLSPKTTTEPIQILETDQTLGKTDLESVHTSTLFKCCKCDKEFTTSRHLHRHKKSHSRKTAYMCKICNKTQLTIERIKCHLTTHLKNYKHRPFSCNKCNRLFNKEANFERHEGRCNGRKVYPCHICNSKFAHQNSLEAHKKIHDSQPNLCILENLFDIDQYYKQIDRDTKPDNVDDCFESEIATIGSEDNNEIKDGEDMDVKDEQSGNGIKDVEDDDITVNDEPSGNEIMDIEDVSVNDEPSNINEICLISEDGIENNCDASLGEFEVKLESEVENLADIKVEDFFESTDNNIMEDGDNAPDFVNDALASCDNINDSENVPKNSVFLEIKAICPSTFQNSDPLHSGVKKENENHDTAADETAVENKHFENEDAASKIHKCKLCDSEFKKLQDFRRHVANHSAKQLCCQWCGKRFMRSDKLKQHLKKHTNGKGFNCELCHKVFHRLENLEKHKSSEHNEDKIINEKKFECPVCFKSFATEKYREIHEESHNEIKKFQCKVCKMTFTSRRQLSEHSVFHKEIKKFLCLECGQRFSRNDHLVIHMRQHVSFKCKYCEKGFRRRNDLTVHEKCHTGERSHLCTVCGKVFSRRDKLTVHIMQAHESKKHQCMNIGSKGIQRSTTKPCPISTTLPLESDSVVSDMQTNSLLTQ